MRIKGGTVLYMYTIYWWSCWNVLNTGLCPNITFRIFPGESASAFFFNIYTMNNRIRKLFDRTCLEIEYMYTVYTPPFDMPNDYRDFLRIKKYRKTVRMVGRMLRLYVFPSIKPAVEEHYGGRYYIVRGYNLYRCAVRGRVYKQWSYEKTKKNA